MPKSTSADVFAVMYNLVCLERSMPHIHIRIHISDTSMLCDAGVVIHTENTCYEYEYIIG